jgi:hypothetical protein
MTVQDSHVCKYYQTGFCKYRNYCKNKHVKDECEINDCGDKTCPKRHPKECRKFIINGKCKFNQECSYKHSEKHVLTYQNKVNEAVANVTMKHEKDVNDLKEEVNELKLALKLMEDQIKNMEFKFQSIIQNSETAQEVEIIEDVDLQKNVTPEPINKVGKDMDNRESEGLICDICSNKFKTEKTLNKHTNTKHPGHKTCGDCGKKFSSTKDLENHQNNDHKKEIGSSINLNDVTEEDLADLEEWNYPREEGDEITEEELAELEQWNY